MESVKIGSRLWWKDPDRGTCSGWGTVARLGEEPIEEDTIITLDMDNGGVTEAHIHELYVREPYRILRNT